MDALRSGADIVIMGGAAGCGKTWSLLLEPLRHKDNPDFAAVTFRRTSPQITNPGGLWDASHRLYRQFHGTEPKRGVLEWVFPSGAKFKFSHLEYEDDKFAYDGTEIPFIGWDQLEHFTEGQFFYLLSRNRSTCGIRPYVRATCNPVPDDDEPGGWLNKFLSWWIDPETGSPAWARSGLVRWFVRVDDAVVWADTPEAITAKYPEQLPLSVTFVPGRLEDNPKLTEADPGYKAKLMALPLVERERLLGGNWHARPAAGKVFNRAWFEIVSAAPADLILVRYWDKAGTAEELAQRDGAATAGVKMGWSPTRKLFYVVDVIVGQWGAFDRESVIKQTAYLDGPEVEVVVEQEPGSGGKESAENTVQNLMGFNVRADRVTGDKLTRAYPLSAQTEARNVKLLVGSWNEPFIRELHRFDGKSKRKDQVDAASGAFNKLAEVANNQFDIAGGGQVEGIKVETNGGGQEVDSSVMAGIKKGGFWWPG